MLYLLILHRGHAELLFNRHSGVPFLSDFQIGVQPRLTLLLRLGPNYEGLLLVRVNFKGRLGLAEGLHSFPLLDDLVGVVLG